MLKTNMLKKIKKCGVLLLALVISAAAVLRRRQRDSSGK